MRKHNQICPPNEPKLNLFDVPWKTGIGSCFLLRLMHPIHSRETITIDVIFSTDWFEKTKKEIQNLTLHAIMNGFEHSAQIRVRYAETDRMGYVYYGNYAAYYEVGRVEALRALGCTYRSLEDSGILLPVKDFSIQYKKPAYYDELLTVVTRIPEMPGSRIRFEYEMFNEMGDLLNQGATTLVFVSAANGRPTKPPESFLRTLLPFFPHE